MTYDIYMYEVAVMPEGETPDISGFEVEATDGSIGHVDEHTYDTGASFLVVDTGPWIFGKKVMLPAGVIREVDLDNEVIYVDRTRDEIKDSPVFDETTYRDETYRSDLGDYYARKQM
ncbi:MAG TPA: PRC-barrel domain-containing protein [Acidimicrobiia bacterium]|nr:PRC-barrel domain-containing protein [Acidimicrobiia bacterium]